MLPFWPKLAGAEDAPNYRPTAGDDRCENCAYYRALNNGAGYCERFSFECEPQSVCDDYVRAGQSKVSAAPTGVLDRLRSFASNPLTKSIGTSALIGAGAGAGMGAVGSGQEAGSSAVSGALAGGLAGTGIGTLGPLMRAGIISKQFGPKMDQALKDFDTKSARRFDKFKIDDYVTQSRTKRIDTDIDAANTKLTDIEAKLRKTNLAIKQRKGSNNPADAAALQRLEVLRNAHLKNRANMESKINQLESSRNNISMLRRQTEQGRKGMTDRIADERKALEAQKKKGPSFIPEDLSRSGKMEAAGVPALSTLVGGGLGFGVSHDAKEQERYRQFRQR